MNLELKKIFFNKEERGDFNTVLSKKINSHFKDSKTSPKANFWMVAKTLFLLGLTGLSYAFLLADVTGTIGIFAFYLLLGFFLAIAAMNIAHDALHGAYFSSPMGNRLLGLVMDLAGGSSFYWKKEHTIDHHTYTNIAEHDADLDAPFLLRLCPKAAHYRFHRFQQWYAPFLYSLNLMRWVYFSDFKRLCRLLRKQHPGKQESKAFQRTPRPSTMEVITLLSMKCVHMTIFLIIPIFVLSAPWWLVFLAYVGLLALAGLIVTVVFQLAHIVEDVAFPLPDTEGKIDNSFARHQLATTSNFGVNNWLVRFLFGGLNFQVEHHLCPHICHIHLHKISPILKETASEFGLPYYANISFSGAIRSHFRTLKKLGAVTEPALAGDDALPEAP